MTKIQYFFVLRVEKKHLCFVLKISEFIRFDKG